ncbi:MULTISPECIES: hypothetical protein [Nostocales]|jgi:hypothetical protein|uniref:Uncharacterized protein n=1 Tax=Dolichospermum flos-aquae UHCC 0037 TaxID=2590026 RepID=A0ACC7SAV8_DOLFA|nr:MULTISPECIES: hypothetical protein [Nostocales]MBO1068135.1 hypothetical protein [Dolichospermum sp. DEX189]MCX5982554.1 hypothetical protein [Nostocales cyanobacterium LacPavin_0920_SED1_MAG_38_18]QSV73683.1 MAG: hypothetical protein HEQ20_26540 [Aphanizomenon flos-aquae KM1D3_PB]ALB41327.1 hypothetical protein AA650_13430 [Anabaena sp. WA102]KHG42220.1 hypothetical protein OA07_06590 [Aphanizomenon flos-aquae 2012/KM1/D3]
MTQDLTQKWLTEIQSLTQQMTKFQRERDEAWESSQKWRQLYNTEAEQRRVDAKMHQEAMVSIKAEVQKFSVVNGETGTDMTTAIQQEISQFNSIEELQTQLLEVIQERDCLLQALKLEQENHAQTRKSLTTALGDAIDSLARLRAGSKNTGGD